ncbi:GNAT family N-acetyltransferase [Deinococcus pimensis]|uniref:GNAT family N-acetyltransferase n=1 Tax=Deinococcus pimensis TaxID=309888 RepID=UPI001B7FE1D2|nr:GNAT family N-acetyltransferase [Deinococcus pimensis]
MGYAYVARSAWHPPAWFQTEVFVRPDARGRGVGSELARRADAASREVGAETLTTWVGGGSPDGERFATRRGFREVQRFVTMTLSVDDADGEVLRRALENARSRGVTLLSFDETGGSPAARRALYDLNRRLAPLLPGNGDDFPSFEEYAREIIDAPWFRPQGQLVAAVEGRWVGLVGLGVHDDGREVRHEFTAVDPAFRRAACARPSSVNVLRAQVGRAGDPHGQQPVQHGDRPRSTGGSGRTCGPAW